MRNEGVTAFYSPSKWSNRPELSSVIGFFVFNKNEWDNWLEQCKQFFLNVIELIYANFFLSSIPWWCGPRCKMNGAELKLHGIAVKPVPTVATEFRMGESIATVRAVAFVDTRLENELLPSHTLWGGSRRGFKSRLHLLKGEFLWVDFCIWTKDSIWVDVPINCSSSYVIFWAECH